jgi:arginine repressor
MRTLARVMVAFLTVSVAFAADDVVSAVHGSVEKIDSTSKTIVVKTADGTEHTLHLVKSTTVHGADASAKGAEDSWHGVEKGSEVVAHYTKRGADDTAVEVDRIGKGGLKVTTGTIKSIDRGGKVIVVKTGDGTEETFKLTDHAVKDAGKGIAEGTEKGTKVVVYSTEDAGKKIAHFFE